MINVEIENPINLMMEIVYINGMLNGVDKPECVELNKLVEKLMEFKK